MLKIKQLNKIGVVNEMYRNQRKYCSFIVVSLNLKFKEKRSKEKKKIKKKTKQCVKCTYNRGV